MSLDVYAGDDYSSADLPSPQDAFELNLIADAEPDVLLRIAVQLMTVNIAPARFTMSRRGDGTVAAWVLLRGCSAEQVELVRRKLLQLTCIVEVSVAERANHGGKLS